MQTHIKTSVLTLAAGAIGAAAAWAISFPIYPITGSALFISLLCVAGIRCAIADPIRDCALLFIGISIGTGINAQAATAFSTWPIAFAVLAATILVVLLVSRFILIRFFNFDTRSATLAAAPGHLTFVLSFSSSLPVNIVPIAVVQAVRVLALTICVPVIAMISGIDTSTNMLPTGGAMNILNLIALAVVSAVAAMLLRKINVPAPFLIAAMLVSSATQITGLTPGVLSPYMLIPCLVIVGIMIGTRFSDISLQQLRSSLLAGLITTIATVSLAGMAAIPVALLLGMPTAHVLVAFAPGGLETMVAVGAVLGANAGFVAACHVGRLFFLTLLVPVFVGRLSDSTKVSDSTR